MATYNEKLLIIIFWAFMIWGLCVYYQYFFSPPNDNETTTLSIMSSHHMVAYAVAMSVYFFLVAMTVWSYIACLLTDPGEPPRTHRALEGRRKLQSAAAHGHFYTSGRYLPAAKFGGASEATLDGTPTSLTRSEEETRRTEEVVLLTAPHSMTTSYGGTSSEQQAHQQQQQQQQQQQNKKKKKEEEERAGCVEAAGGVADAAASGTCPCESPKSPLPPRASTHEKTGGSGGAIPIDDSDGDDSGGSERFCDVCHWEKPARCHHCSACRRCILRYDHHCPWIGQCVGRRNHKLFALLLFYSFLLSWYMCLTLTASFIHTLTRGIEDVNKSAYTAEQTISKHAPNIMSHVNKRLPRPMNLKSGGFTYQVIVIFVACYFIQSFVSYLLYKQVKQIRKNMTTLEVKIYGSAYPSDYDRGLKQNVEEVFGKKRSKWLPIEAFSPGDDEYYE